MMNKAVVWHHQASSQVPGQYSNIELSHSASLVNVSSFPVIPRSSFYIMSWPLPICSGHLSCGLMLLFCCGIFLGRVIWIEKRWYCWKKDKNTLSVSGHSKASEPDRKYYSPLNTAGPCSGCLCSTKATCFLCDHRLCLLTQSDFNVISTFFRGICILPDLFGYYHLNPFVYILDLDDTLSTIFPLYNR